MKLFPMFLELQISIDSVGGTFRFHHNIWFDLFSPNKKNMRRDSKFPFTSIFWEGFSVHPGHWWLICALFNGSSFWSQRDFRESRSAFFSDSQGVLRQRYSKNKCYLPYLVGANYPHRLATLCSSFFFRENGRPKRNLRENGPPLRGGHPLRPLCSSLSTAQLK